MRSRSLAYGKRLRIAMSDCGSLYGKSGLRPSEGPVMWQKLSEAMNRVAGDTGQDVFEPGEGIDIHALTGGYESAQHSGRSTADIAAEKHPVVAAHGHTTNAALGACVVDFQMPVFRVAVERHPVFESVAH